MIEQGTMEQLMRMDKGVAVILITFGLPTLIAIVWVVAAYWHKIRRAEIDTNLKLKMVEQGMSADDIIRVLQTSSVPQREEAVGQHRREAEFAAALEMADRGMSADEIVRVLQASSVKEENPMGTATARSS